MAEIDSFDFTPYKEVVFCGYGEPTQALDNLIESAKYLKEKYGLDSYRSVITNGTKERYDVADWGESGKGGLKIQFLNKEKEPVAFIWMRGSGTEPVFRIMCDVRGSNSQMEKDLLKWETELLGN